MIRLDKNRMGRIIILLIYGLFGKEVLNKMFLHWKAIYC